MSGGAYDYLSSKIGNSEGLAEAHRYSERIAADLGELLKALEDGVVKKVVGHPSKPLVGVYEPYTDREKIEAEMAVALVARHWQVAVRRVRDAESILNKLADVLHALEWWQSCDYGPDDAVAGCVAYMRKVHAFVEGDLT